MKLTLRLIFKFIRLLLIPAVGCSLLAAASLYLYLSPKLPSVETLKTVKLQTPLRVYSQDLKLIGEFGEKRRSPVTFEEIPLLFVQAVLAAEDDAFYQHIGVDFKGLLRAGIELATTGHIQTGGSTITMQLARNFFLTRERSFIRKFNEILLALRIEDELSKNDIFTLYANKIYLGNRAYGAEAAALTYYGESIRKLGLSQLAMIAGLPKAPSTFNPIINPERAMKRRDWILNRMFKLGFISAAKHQSALKSRISAQYHGPIIDYNAPYAAEHARAKALAELGLAAYTNGYAVITTLNSTLQQKADQALRKGLSAYDWRHGYHGPETHVDDPEQWQTTLTNTPIIAGLQPAIIKAVSETGLSVITSSDEELLLSSKHKTLSSLREFISENHRGPTIKVLADIFSPGDLIRINYDENNIPYLTQLPQAQSALISLDPDTGAIKALTGGFDFYQSHFNRVYQAKRQPGSNFKPFIYTAALEQGMTAASIVNDAPVVFDGDTTEKAWRPENSSGQFYGPTRLREALYRSRNLVSIRVLRRIGINTALETIDKFGFDKDELPQDLSLALGSHALTPIKVAAGYATFANGGYKIEPYLIERIEHLDGEVVYQANSPTVCRSCELNEASSDLTSPTTLDNPDQVNSLEAPSIDTLIDSTATASTPEEANPTNHTSGAITGSEPRPAAKQIIDPRVAYLIDSMLKDVIIRGTGVKAKALKRADIAGKTGTTNGPRDAWFSGYNLDLVTTVWLGFDDNKLLGRREFGGSAALPIWMDYMATALAGKKQRFHPQPEGLVSVKIDPTSGLRAAANTQNAIFELFREENIPADVDQSGSSSAYDSHPTPMPEDIF
ncbi:MAG: penicillin-binding protein 1A [Porticoccaceae bacterium]|nr:penicillin-binding protein 1A [Porticoccaceae bacterium]